VDDVLVHRRGLVLTVKELVRMDDHLAEKRRQRAELDRLSFRPEVDGLVNQRPHQGEIRFASSTRELPRHLGESPFMFLLYFVERRHGALEHGAFRTLVRSGVQESWVRSSSIVVTVPAL
jgi:hypothetical protein